MIEKGMIAHPTWISGTQCVNFSYYGTNSGTVERLHSLPTFLIHTPGNDSYNTFIFDNWGTGTKQVLCDNGPLRMAVLTRDILPILPSNYSYPSCSYPAGDPHRPFCAISIIRGLEYEGTVTIPQVSIVLEDAPAQFLNLLK